MDEILINTDAEKYVLGCVILYATKTMNPLIEAECERDWFYSHVHKTIWDLCAEMHEKKKPIDQLTISDLAKKKGSLPGIISAIDECTSSGFIYQHAMYYGGIIKDLAHKRKQQVLLQKHLADLATDKSAIDISADIKFELDKIKYEDVIVKSETDILALIRARYNTGNEHGFVGIPSRWLSLQRKLGGYKKGKMCILAARPSIGKTTVACNEARYMAENGYNVGIISLETDEEEIYEMMAAEKSGIDLFKMYNGELEPGELEKFDKALQQVLKLPVYVSDKSMDIKHIVNWMNLMCARKKLDVILIDYIQIISDCPALKLRNTRDKISYYSKQIFKATRDNDVATILLSQIGRGGEIPPGTKTEDRWKFVPRLHHLKESGAIEEDAYQAIILYNDPDDGDVQGRTRVTLIMDVAKNKKGPIGYIRMTYDKSKQKVQDKIYEHTIQQN